MRSPFTIIIGVLCVHCLAEEITPAPLPEPVVEAVSKAETALLKARQEYESANKIVLERTTRSLEKYVRTATQEGNITSAMETQQLIEDMQAGIFLINFNQKYFSNSLLLGEEEQVISPVKVIPVVIDGTKKIGCEVGPVSKGQYFVLQYMSGKWKGWGGIPSENPDAKEQERGDECRLAIVIDDETVAVVPPETSAKPYVFQSTKNGRMTLRINDSDGDWTSNPAGSVIYKLGIR